MGSSAQVQSPAIVKRYLDASVKSNYSDVIAVNVANIKNGQFCIISDDTHGGLGKYVNSTAHGITSNEGVNVRIDDNWYWKRDLSVCSDINVKWFNVNLDGSGDQQTEFYSALLESVGTCKLPAGMARTESTLYVPRRLLIKGSGLIERDPYDSLLTVVGSIIRGAHTGAAVLSFKGVSFGGAEDIGIVGDETVIPQTGLCLGRGSASSAGIKNFKNVNVSGSFSKAAIYCIADEENTFTHLQAAMYGGSALDTLYMSKDDDLVVDSLFSSSQYVATFVGARLLNQTGNANSSVIHIKGSYGLQGISFLGGFTNMASGPNSAHVRITVDEDTDPKYVMSNLVFDGMSHEATSNANPPVTIYSIEGTGSGSTLRGLTIKNSANGQDNGGTQYFINANITTKLIGADISNNMMHHPSVFNALEDCVISLPGERITIENTNVPKRCTINASEVVLTRPNLECLDDNIFKCPVYNTPVFNGGGLNDLTISDATEAAPQKYRKFIIRISGDGSPNQFDWSMDGGATFTLGVNITGSDQALSDGIVINFGATTGHTVNDEWIFELAPAFYKMSSNVGNVKYRGGSSNSVSTSNTVIYTLPTTSSITKLSIVGVHLSHYFIDTVAVMNGVVTVVSSTTITGTPEARTYTFDGVTDSVELSMGANTYVVKVAPLEFV